MWCGFTREPNDIKYLKQILGSEVEKLSKLEDGQFLYLTRKSLSKINIEPYDNNTFKTEIPQLPEPKLAQPIRTKQETNIVTFLRVGMIIFFTALLLGAIK
jgi:hypothetical protein